MAGAVAVGVDGSRESMAAVAWATAEAGARGASLRLVCAQDWPTGLRRDSSPEAESRAAARLRQARTRALELRPASKVTGEVRDEAPAEVLLEAAGTADLLVLGSRGLGGVEGFVLGSVGLSVLAHAARPVVAVRARDPHTAGPVVAGLDLHHSYEAVLEFAFAYAARRGRLLRVVHAWSLPLWYLWRPFAVYRGRAATRPVEPGTSGRRRRRIGARY